MGRGHWFRHILVLRNQDFFGKQKRLKLCEYRPMTWHAVTCGMTLFKLQKEKKRERSESSKFRDWHACLFLLLIWSIYSQPDTPFKSP